MVTAAKIHVSKPQQSLNQLLIHFNSIKASLNLIKVKNKTFSVINKIQIPLS